MVEINNQHGAFLDAMLAWSEELITDVRKPKSWVWRHCRRRAIYWLLRSPSQTCHAKPKTQINRRRTLPASFPLRWDAYRKQLGLKDFSSRKVRTLWRRSKFRSVALYLWLIVVISVRQSTVAAISGLHCRALVMVSSSISWQPDCKIQRSGRTVREINCMSRVTAIISALVICIMSACHGLLIITVITPLPTKPARQKCQRTETGERGNYWHADASAWCCCARCKIHEE